MALKVEEHASTKITPSSPAPGGPGADPRWAKANKDAVGTATSAHSRIWFTIVDGALSEVFFPAIDLANTRSVRFLVTDGREFFSDGAEQRHTVRAVEPFAPHYRIRTQEKDGRYCLEKEVVPDPSRDAILMRVHFEAKDKNLRLFLFAVPNIGDLGEDNDAWVGEYKSVPMLFAQRGELALAVGCSTPWKKAGAGFIGVNDGLTDLRRHKQMTETYTEALQGNISLAAEIDWAACQGRFTVVLASGEHPAAAGQQARAGLLQKFDRVRDSYVEGWRKAQDSWLDLSRGAKNGVDCYRVSTAVLQTHESKLFPGGIVASLSTPWGFARGDKAAGGYHVLWPRDMGEAALARLAHGDPESAGRTLFFLRCTQEAAGNWGQNMWLDGTPHWTGTQMDGPSLAILLADFLRREGVGDTSEHFQMVRDAAGFLVRVGPYTEQDRWEEAAGYTPFTMAAEIAALLAAADFADEEKKGELATFLRETADAWNAMVEEMTYVEGTELAKQHGVAGYYMRIAPPEAISSPSPGDLSIQIKNLPEGQGKMNAADIVSVDALALVRFGLRSATDKRILNTVAVIDAMLRKQVSTGPVWHRYNNDGYGEQADGAPFEKTGIGRGWPLFAGERAHFEVARGNFEEAERLREVMEAQTNECGLLPEQIWDAEDIPERELFNGHPTGSSMPLVWAHAEYIKLLRSLKEKKVWDMPPQTAKRYAAGKTQTRFNIWSFSQQRAHLQAGMNLRVDLLAAARVHWTLDNWQTTHETETKDSGLGLHYALLDLHDRKEKGELIFTFFWTEAKKWEGKNFLIS